MDLLDANTHSWNQAQNHTQLNSETAKKKSYEGGSCLSFKIHFQALLWSREDWEFMQMSETAEILRQSWGSRS